MRNEYISTMTPLDQFYMNLDEPLQSYMLGLRDILSDLHPDITEEWKYRLPFFYYKKKMFCYLWKDKSTQEPYIGVVKGDKITHPMLVQGDRKRMKILPLSTSEDIPVELITDILVEAMTHY